jgi:hypothetical protein
MIYVAIHKSYLHANCLINLLHTEENIVSAMNGAPQIASVWRHMMSAIVQSLMQVTWSSLGIFVVGRKESSFTIVANRSVGREQSEIWQDEVIAKYICCCRWLQVGFRRKQQNMRIMLSRTSSKAEAIKPHVCV